MGETSWALVTVDLGLLVTVTLLAGWVRRGERATRQLRSEMARLREQLDRLVQRQGPASGSAEAPVPAEYVLGGDEEPRPAAAYPARRVTPGEPLIKIAAFTFGVRRALGEESRALIAYRVRRELKRRRSLRRTGTRRAA